MEIEALPTELETLLYIKKDNKAALNLIENNIKDFISTLSVNLKMGNKHKCNRNRECKCIPLGHYYIDVLLNSDEKMTTEIIIKKLETFYYNPNITLPFPLFKYLIINLIKLLELQSLRPLIENYLTYSKLSGKLARKSTSSAFEISLTEYEELNKILIFDVILVLDGFNRAKAKIQTIPDETLRDKFIEEFDRILFKYTKEKEKVNAYKYIQDNPSKDDNEEVVPKYDPELYAKLTQIMDKNSHQVSINTNFSEYKVENSLLQKLVSIILNKKILKLAASLLFLISLYRIKIYFGIKLNLISTLGKVTPNWLKNLMIVLKNLILGLLKLIVNY